MKQSNLKRSVTDIQENLQRLKRQRIINSRAVFQGGLINDIFTAKKFDKKELHSESRKPNCSLRLTPFPQQKLLRDHSEPRINNELYQHLLVGKERPKSSQVQLLRQQNRELQKKNLENQRKIALLTSQVTDLQREKYMAHKQGISQAEAFKKQVMSVVGGEDSSQTLRAIRQLVRGQEKEYMRYKIQCLQNIVNKICKMIGRTQQFDNFIQAEKRIS